MSHTTTDEGVLMRKRYFLAVAAIAVLSLGALAAACGGDDDNAPNAGSTGASTGAATGSAGSTGGSNSNTGAGGGNGGTTVAAIDLGYQPTEIEGYVGEEVTIDFKNTGSLPHTFTIDGVVDSGSVAGGGSKMITFTPTSAGELQFYCTVHGKAAMSGTVEVEQR
jgi:plastocyanin